VWESKHRKHPKNVIVLKGFFYDRFLNHAIVIIKELFAILILYKRFSKTCTLSKLIYFYHTLHLLVAAEGYGRVYCLRR
jgi:hypothetical protein